MRRSLAQPLKGLRSNRLGCSSLGLGLLWGSVARNLQQALLLSFFTVISGVLVPIESMSRSIQLLSLLSPLRYHHEFGLGIFLEGVGTELLRHQALAMGSQSLGIFRLGIWQFGRQVG